MFWYIKYPLIIILTLAFLGLAGLVWRSCIKDVSKLDMPGGEPQSEVVVTAKPGTSEPATPDTVTSAYTVPVPQYQHDYSRIEKLLDSAGQQLQYGKLEAARTLAHNAMKLPGLIEYDRYWLRAADIINEANRRFMNDGAPSSEKKRYNVRHGDNLSKIASNLLTSVSALKRLNGLRGDNPLIQPGQVLSYIQGAWSIKVSKSEYILCLYNDGELYRYYRVGIGKEDRTPVGDFLISSRIRHPAWTPPGKNIPYGSPENVLGTHWLGLVPVEGTDPTLRGYGIHGTWEPDSIGTASSSGCVRLRNEDIEELFDFVPEPGGVAPPVRVKIVE